MFSEDRKNQERYRTYGTYLGPKASVHDEELAATALPLTEEDSHTLLILTDSRASIANMRNRAPPRSSMEKDSLRRRQDLHMDTAIAWVRGHIGIPGNAKADHQALLQSYLGRLRGEAHTVTPAGLSAKSKIQPSQERRVTSFGQNHSTWNRLAMTAYTQLRTNKGPFGSWLHHIGKRDTAVCPRGHPSQDGPHITFHCPINNAARSSLPSLLQSCSWADLDTPIYIKEAEDQEAYEATEHPSRL